MASRCPRGRRRASQKGRTPRTNAVGHHPEVVRAVRVDAVPADLEHDLRLELIFSVGIEVVLERLQEARVRVLEGQDHGRLVGLVVVRLDRQLARAGLYYFMLDDVLLARACETREAPGACCGERARQDEAAHRAALAYKLCSRLFWLTFAPRGSEQQGGVRVLCRRLFTTASYVDDAFGRLSDRVRDLDHLDAKTL